MTILETAILFKGKSLCEEQFYSSKENINDIDREFLTKTLGILVKSTSYDKIHKFSMGEFKILIKLKSLEVTDGDVNEEVNNQPSEQLKNPPLVIYCIAGINADQKHINTCMEDAITQFLEKFSISDIITKKTKKFKSFNERLKIIFKEIALKPEDRFKSILF